jgi:hypothetical protein
VTSEKRLHVSLLLLRVKAALILATPGLAMAAEQAMLAAARRGGLEAVSVWQWFFLFAFSMLGWAVSELDKVAELWNVEGRSKYELMKERLKLLKTVAASIAAGSCVYLLGQEAPAFFLRAIGVAEASTGGASPAIPEMVLFVFVAGAGYMGARWFAWLEAKFFGPRP